MLDGATNITGELFRAVCRIFDEAWDGTPLRQLGVQMTCLAREPLYTKPVTSVASDLGHDLEVPHVIMAMHQNRDFDYIIYRFFSTFNSVKSMEIVDKFF